MTIRHSINDVEIKRSVSYDEELRQLWVELLRHTDSVVLSKDISYSYRDVENQVLTPRRGRWRDKLAHTDSTETKAVLWGGP